MFDAIGTAVCAAVAPLRDRGSLGLWLGSWLAVYGFVLAVRAPMVMCSTVLCSTVACSAATRAEVGAAVVVDATVGAAVRPTLDGGAL